MSEQTLSQDKALFRAEGAISVSSAETVAASVLCCDCCEKVLNLVACTVGAGVIGEGGGVMQTGKLDCEASVAIFTEDTGLGMGDMEVVSWKSSLLQN